MVKLHDVNVNDGQDMVSTTEYRTGAVRNNGFCPIWNRDSDIFKFTVRCPDIALIEFTVMDCDHGFLDVRLSLSSAVIHGLKVETNLHLNFEGFHAQGGDTSELSSQRHPMHPVLRQVFATTRAAGNGKGLGRYRCEV